MHPGRSFDVGYVRLFRILDMIRYSHSKQTKPDYILPLDTNAAFFQRCDFVTFHAAFPELSCSPQCQTCWGPCPSPRSGLMLAVPAHQESSLCLRRVRCLLLPLRGNKTRTGHRYKLSLHATTPYGVLGSMLCFDKLLCLDPYVVLLFCL